MPSVAEALTTVFDDDELNAAVTRLCEMALPNCIDVLEAFRVGYTIGSVVMLALQKGAEPYADLRASRQDD